MWKQIENFYFWRGDIASWKVSKSQKYRKLRKWPFNLAFCFLMPLYMIRIWKVVGFVPNNGEKNIEFCFYIFSKISRQFQTRQFRGIGVLDYLNNIFCKNIINVLKPRCVWIQFRKLPDAHGIIESRSVPSLFPREREFCQLHFEQ